MSYFLAFADIKSINVDEGRMSEDDNNNKGNIMECWMMIMMIMMRRYEETSRLILGMVHPVEIGISRIPIPSQNSKTQLLENVYSYGS